MLRCFPPPWRAEERSGRYVVRDANGQAIAHIYPRQTESKAMAARSRFHGARSLRPFLLDDSSRRIAASD